MDKLEAYLTVIPLPLLAVVGFFALMIFLIMPAESRFYVTFILMPVWLTTSRCPDLGFIQAFTKISSGMLFLLMGVSALLRPGNKRPMPGMAWLYFAASMFYLICVIGTSDKLDAIVMEIQWVFAVLAAVAAVMAMTTLEDVHKMFMVFGLGMIIALCVPLSALILNPSTSFLLGTNRFVPWGSPPNLIGLLFVVAGPTLLYLIMTTKSHSIKPILIGFLIANIGMAILTGSRMTVFSLVISLGLMALPLVKRPGLLIAGGLIGAILLPVVLGVNVDSADRLGDLSTSGRLAIWWNYLVLSLKRPLGLFGTSGYSIVEDPTISAHPHSSWAEMLYLGGWPYLLLLAVPAIYALRCTYQVWKQRDLYSVNNHSYLIHAMAAFMASMYFQSFFNQALYHPTYTLTFVGLFLTFLFMALAAELPQQRESYEEWLEEWSEEEYDEYEEWDDTKVPAPT